MKTILATIILLTAVTPSTLAKGKCDPKKHLEISCSGIEGNKRNGFCLRIEKKDKLTESKKVKICQSIPRKMRKK